MCCVYVVELSLSLSLYACLCVCVVFCSVVWIVLCYVVVVVVVVLCVCVFMCVWLSIYMCVYVCVCVCVCVCVSLCGPKPDSVRPRCNVLSLSVLSIPLSRSCFSILVSWLMLQLTPGAAFLLLSLFLVADAATNTRRCLIASASQPAATLCCHRATPWSVNSATWDAGSWFVAVQLFVFVCVLSSLWVSLGCWFVVCPSSFLFVFCLSSLLSFCGECSLSLPRAGWRCCRVVSFSSFLLW